jgi:exosortase
VDIKHFWQPVLVIVAVTFLYAAVLSRLFGAWWTDENYSHGLLIPLVIGFILWNERGNLSQTQKNPSFILGSGLVILALLLLFVGTLGAEIFTQRVSLMVMLGGIVVYFFGWKLWRWLLVPFILLLLAIPIPTIIFNRIAFPLQLLATQVAVDGIRLFAIPVVRQGNVIELLPRGAAQVIWLEVVEACSGIRSLMTLVTLALIYAYFTRRERELKLFNYDFWRALLLMISAVPIAILTNAARVTLTGILAYNYGKQTAEGFLHSFSGWMVYLVALAMLVGLAWVLDFGAKFLRKPKTPASASG